MTLKPGSFTQPTVKLIMLTYATIINANSWGRCLEWIVFLKGGFILRHMLHDTSVMQPFVFTSRLCSDDEKYCMQQGFVMHHMICGLIRWYMLHDSWHATCVVVWAHLKSVEIRVGWLVGWLVGLGLTTLWDSISVYIGPSPREREKEKRSDRWEKKCPNNPYLHLPQAQ